MWMWVDVNGTPIATSVLDTIRERRLEKYLADRDGYRAARGKPPIWVGTKPAFASLQYKLDKSHRGDMGRRVKIIWDKGWHGGNIGKSDKVELEDIHVYYVDSLTDRDTGSWSVSMWRV